MDLNEIDAVDLARELLRRAGVEAEVTEQEGLQERNEQLEEQLKAAEEDKNEALNRAEDLEDRIEELEKDSEVPDEIERVIEIAYCTNPQEVRYLLQRVGWTELLATVETQCMLQKYRAELSSTSGSQPSSGSPSGK